MSDYSTPNDDDPSSTEVLFLRPFGYVSEDPAVDRIGDRDLFVGNAAAAESPDTSDRFDSVLSLTETPRHCTTDHRPLVDGPENEWGAFEAAADAARRLDERDGSLLVHCKAGISRSSTVAATVIAATEERNFVDALHLVQDAHPHAIPHLALHQQAVCYLASRG